MAALSPELRTILRWLRRTHPLPLPTRVILTTRMPEGSHDANGTFEELPHEHPERFLIRLQWLGSALEMRETLLHEWAHGVAFVDQLVANSHGHHDTVFMGAYERLVEEFSLAFPHLPLRRDRL